MEADNFFDINFSCFLLNEIGIVRRKFTWKCQSCAHESYESQKDGILLKLVCMKQVWSNEILINLKWFVVGEEF